MKVATWNVNECFGTTLEFRKNEKKDNIDEDNINKIINKINENNFDVVCFQEYPVLIDGEEKLTQRIINETNLKYYICKDTSDSYYFKGGRIGVAIFSRFKTKEEFITLFNNPYFEIPFKGKIIYPFDKAIIKTKINDYIFITGHSISFVPFGHSEFEYPESYKPLEDLIDKYYKEKIIVLGDFNCERLFELLPSINGKVIDSVKMPTTKDYYEKRGGLQMDYILVNPKLKVNKKEKIDNFSDHYIICEEIN